MRTYDKSYDLLNLAVKSWLVPINEAYTMIKIQVLKLKKHTRNCIVKVA